MAKQSESGEESYKQKLLPVVDGLCNEFEALVDSPLDEREALTAIFNVLKDIRAKISSPPPPPPPPQDDGKKVDAATDDKYKLLPRSKWEELGNVLPLIRAALVERAGAVLLTLLLLRVQSVLEPEQTESGEESYKQKLLREVDGLCKVFEALDDRPLAERDALTAIFNVLREIRAKISSPPPPPPQDDGKKVDAATATATANEYKLLPRSKWEELGNVLPLIWAALEQRSKRPRGRQDAAAAGSSAGGVAAADDSKLTGCIPCKPRASKQQQQQSKKQQQEQEDGVSLTLLLWMTRSVKEPEQYYEWTTSYVEEERIYGWEKEAGEVMDALVAPDGSERMFRAAGIAGIHGSGKTALAQKVFVHDKAKDNFALRLWVCVGPPDSEDRFNLLYRMLDNLGLDTAKVEAIVDKSNVVAKAKDEEKKRIMEKPEAAAELRKKAAETAKKEKEEGNVVTAATSEEDAKRQAKEAEDRIFEELLQEKIDNSRAVETSKIGVLLYILNMSLSKTSYMIVFDDIRAYRRDDDDVHTHGCWYSNLTLPPPAEGEWGDRLAYGLPKGEHRAAVLVTCRKEDDAKTMARTGLVVRPPKLQGDDAWKLFRREYDQAKDDRRNKEGGKQGSKEEDLLLKQLEKMKKEIVDKCLGLPVAIIEAARGFADLDPLPDLPEDTSPMKEDAAEAKPAAAGGRTESSKDMPQAEAAAAAAEAE